MDKEKELKPYKYDKLSKIPSWIKILFLKFWAAGAAFYFVGIGGSFIGKNNDLVYFVILALVTGLFMEYIVKQIVRLMKNSKDNTFRYNLVNIKGTPGLLLNLLYAFIITEPIGLLINLIVAKNLWINFFGSSAKGAEPFLWGFIYILFDAVFIGVKNLIINISTASKNKKLESKDSIGGPNET